MDKADITIILGAAAAFVFYIIRKLRQERDSLKAELTEKLIQAKLQEATAKTEAQRVVARKAREKYEELIKKYNNSLLPVDDDDL
jgi:predicted Holliday junction resolvase-like endonuclease